MKKNLQSVLLLGVLMTITIASNAQLSLVKDLQTAQNTAGSDPSMFIEYNGYLYFAATEPIVGTELWRTDGTATGTTLVKDIKPGGGSSSPSDFFIHKGILYFQADDGSSGKELWKTDGTEAGTKLAADIFGGYGYYNSSNPKNFVTFKDSLFFQGTDTTGTELWKSDGTDSGSFRVKDIFPDTLKKNVQNSSNPQNLIVVNGVLYFQAVSKNKGTELWKSDGSTVGTMLVKDINPDTLNSDPQQFIDLNNTLYFVASNTASGDELWKTNGTEAGTVIVKEINTSGGASITFMTKFNNKLYFSADNGTGNELWVSDGTAGGTVLLKDINPKSGISPSFPSLFTEYKGKLYFTASNGTDGYELWVTDGTATGTVQVKDINPGSAGAEPTLYTVANNLLFFLAQNTTTGNELWKSDGTAAGTVMVKDIYAGSISSSPRYLTAHNNLLIFSAEEGSYGKEPWKSDGTAAGTLQIKDIVHGTKASNPSQLLNMKGVLYFTAESTANGNELFKSNGTAAGTAVVRDIISGASSSVPKNLININDVLYFSADDGSNYGRELWKSNGTSVGTSRVSDINAGIYASDPANFCGMNGKIYFSADDGLYGTELWKSDGTLTGNFLVKDIYPDLGLNGPNSSNPSGLININGTLFFTATDSAHGRELWKSDGTDAGTVLLKDIKTGKSSSVIGSYISYNGKLIFAANDSINGIELWKSDGTTAGTGMITDLFPDTNKLGKLNSSYPQYFCELNGKLYFQATDKTNGTELWQTDGTDTGTKLVKDIMPGSYKGNAYSSNPQNLTRVGNEIYFTAAFPGKGNELCKTDGTEAGTVLYKEIVPGYGGSNPNNLLADGTNLYFVADDGVHGEELWKAELGQCGKTVMTGEIISGKAGTGPTNLCMMGGALYFSASTADYGSELWKYNNAFVYADTANLSFSICTGDSVKVNNKYYKTTGTYRDSLKTTKGCDSLIKIKLTVNIPYFKTSSVSKCIGDSVQVMGIYRKVSGTYIDSLKTKAGCDSIVEVKLAFNPKPPKPTITKEGTATMVSSATTGNQWYDDSGPVAGATSQKYSSTKNQKFYVIVTVDGCSSEPSNSFNPMKGSINDDIFRNIDVYPNPVSDKLIIEFKVNPNNSCNFMINNLDGKEVISGSLTETKNEIDVSGIPQGIYFIKIISDNKIGLIKIVRE
jgi:ELWxxDGT repeat protein